DPTRARRLLAPAVDLRVAAPPAPDLPARPRAAHVVRGGVQGRPGPRPAAPVRRADVPRDAGLARGGRRAAPGRVRRSSGRQLSGGHRGSARLAPIAHRVGLHPDGAAAARAARPLAAGLRRDGRPGVLRLRLPADARPPGRAAARRRRRVHRRAEHPRRGGRPHGRARAPLPLGRGARALRRGARPPPPARAARGGLRRRHRRAHGPRHRRRPGRAAAGVGHPDGRPRLQDRSGGPAAGAEPLLPRHPALRAASRDHGRLRRGAHALRAQRGHAVHLAHEDAGVPGGRPARGLHAGAGRRGGLRPRRRPAGRRRGLRGGLRARPDRGGRAPREGPTAPAGAPLGHHRRADAGPHGRRAGPDPRRRSRGTSREL
ncbi:MAG: hypothetical protein AVDCRST_MAG13-824, partial [uncultured Solirubrobacteraceae bacterium]